MSVERIPYKGTTKPPGDGWYIVKNGSRVNKALTRHQTKSGNTYWERRVPKTKTRTRKQKPMDNKIKLKKGLSLFEKRSALIKTKRTANAYKKRGLRYKYKLPRKIIIKTKKAHTKPPKAPVFTNPQLEVRSNSPVSALPLSIIQETMNNSSDSNSSNAVSKNNNNIDAMFRGNLASPKNTKPSTIRLPSIVTDVKPPAVTARQHRSIFNMAIKDIKKQKERER